MKCHTPSNLESLKKNGIRKPEVIPQDPREREAFAAVINEPDARRRKELAEGFLKTYPSSWMLEPVYEIAAKACIATGDLSAAIEYGALSLRILPENPFLLVALADAETGWEISMPRRGARMRCGTSIASTGQRRSTRRDWPRVKAQLRSGAYLHVGRAAAADASGAGQQGALAAVGRGGKGASGIAAPRSEQRAFRIPAGDGRFEQGRMSDGASLLAMAAKPDGPVRAQAIDRLHARLRGNSRRRGKAVCAVGGIVAPPSLALPPAPERHPRLQSREYAGSAACGDCHGRNMRTGRPRGWAGCSARIGRRT